MGDARPTARLRRAEPDERPAHPDRQRMAVALSAEWLAVAVEPKGDATRPDVRERVARHLRLAEQLGAETHVLVGTNVATTVLECAGANNVTKIIVGKTARPWWRRVLRRGVVDELLDKSADIDVYVIRGRAETDTATRSETTPAPPPFTWRPYLMTGAVVAVCGLLGWLEPDLAVGRSEHRHGLPARCRVRGHRYARTGRRGRHRQRPGLRFLLYSPYLSFAVTDAQYVLTFAVMLVIGLLISALAVRARSSSTRPDDRSAHGGLYRLTKQLSEVVGSQFLVQIAGKQLREIFGAMSVLYVREPGRPLKLRFGQGTGVAAVPGQRGRR